MPSIRPLFFLPIALALESCAFFSSPPPPESTVLPPEIYKVRPELLGTSAPQPSSDDARE
ncbi:MAG: hypothetical protein LBG69_06110 [Zoogloeaceae bacterium]|nr:hypothetical protein [Zoogloeaceae bacterium]